jgi:hypothetical protein
VDACSGMQLNCSGSQRCEIECTGTRSCAAMKVACVDGPCRAKCTGADACLGAELTCGTNDCSATCDVDSAKPATKCATVSACACAGCP